MEENLKSKLGFITFTIIIIALLVGGYFYTKYTINHKEPVKTEENVVKTIKIDKEKDYFYYLNESVISEEAEIYYKDVVINIKDQEELTKKLEKENNIYKNNIKYISKELENGNLISKDIVNYSNDDLYSLKFRNYKTFESSKYLSLVINDFNYSCLDYITFDKTEAYVFNKEDGTYISEEKLLKNYNISIDEIKEQIKNHLSTKQNTEGTIKIDETINDLTKNYALYVNNSNKLCISYLVKTNEVDYNEDMEVNA